MYKRHLAFGEASERRKSKSQWGTLFEFIEEIAHMCRGEATSKDKGVGSFGYLKLSKNLLASYHRSLLRFTIIFPFQLLSIKLLSLIQKTADFCVENHKLTRLMNFHGF